MTNATIFGFVALGLLALIPAKIAERKGGSLLGWWIFGVLFLIIALPAAILKRDHRYGECPWCSEPVRKNAIVCPHCQHEVTPLDERGEPDYTAHAE